ncbi:DUF937 domain-containing protein [Luteitalea sp.]|jgi:hypothetical protein|uniref:DUF937 domain-containing protein n=1 Tax=Luteitalea sp. TaxID=2004800 RepID=UPI0037C9B638
MSLLEQLLGGQNGAAIDQIGRQLGLDPSQTQSAVNALLPMVAAGFQRNASASPQGLDGLLGMLTGGSAAKYVDDPSHLAGAADDGNSILGQIFGSKDVSREVAARAAAQTGLGPEVLKALLPMVATLVMGAMAKGAFSGGAAAAPGQPQVASAGAGGGLLDMLSPMLDSNKDGNVMDDLMGMASKYLK